LARHHYRAGLPAVPVLTLRAVSENRVVGAIVVAMPVLNGPWRRTAWPGWLDGLDKRGHAAAVNAQVRTIARLAVTPQFRGRGVGSELVRAYLTDPLTEKTEALAAMAALCPVFARAGMRQIPCSPSRAAARVARSLRERNVPPWALADASVRRRLAGDACVERALRGLALDRWRAGRHQPAGVLMERLWASVASRPAVFVAERCGRIDG
jgi:GNAT superfamily N-acetyltransferase